MSYKILSILYKMNRVKSVIANGKYILLQVLGGGHFGVVYRGQNVLTNKYVAVKVEPHSTSAILIHEARILQYLCKDKPADVGIPSLKWYGVEFGNCYAVMDLYGPSLSSISSTCKHNWDLCNAYLLQMVSILSYIHRKGIVHRDIKPDNFLSASRGRIVLIDFGMSKIFWNFEKEELFPPQKTNLSIGTPSFMSLKVHQGWEPCRPDDLISTLYTVLYMYLGGTLPWSNSANIGTVIEKKTALDKKVESYSSLGEVWKTAYLSWSRIENVSVPNYSVVAGNGDVVDSMEQK